MKVHLLGGFLGSGKTTAIANAAKLLNENNIKAGVVTNDQGKYLVDSKFISLEEIPNAEVTGGCFCCNYKILDDQINMLKNLVNPSVIFAESVGSCTDLISTVVKPLLKMRSFDIEKVTFSGFVDSRMLLKDLKNEELPFSEETNYIWLKQIEESEILVINKIDLLTPEELNTLKELCNQNYPSKKLLFQNSHDTDSISKWVEELNLFQPEKERRSIDVDYQIYGKGEAQLAWLDEEMEFRNEQKGAVKTAVKFIEDVVHSTVEHNLPVGHLKFLLSTPGETTKISFTTIMNNSWKDAFVLKESDYAHLMVNARIQSTPEKLRSIIINAIDKIEPGNMIQFNEKNISYFQPGFPNPTYRFID